MLAMFFHLRHDFLQSLTLDDSLCLGSAAMTNEFCSLLKTILLHLSPCNQPIF